MIKGKPKDFRINLFNASQKYFAGSDIEGNVFLELSKDMIPVKVDYTVTYCQTFSGGRYVHFGIFMVQLHY